MKIVLNIKWVTPVFSLFLACAAMAQDAGINDNARILGGLQPTDPALAKKLEGTSFQPFSQATERDWNQLRPGPGKTQISARTRLEKMSAWSKSEIPDFDAGCTTLFYPFGSADILNAQKFFPNCRRYLLMGLENVGTFPDFNKILDSSNPHAFDAYLVGARASQSELFRLGYIITAQTQKVQATTKLDGNAALLAYLLVIGGNTLTKIQFFCITPSLNQQNSTDAYTSIKCQPTDIPGVQISFQDASNVAKEVVYLEKNLDNSSFTIQSSVRAYIQRLANEDGHEFTTFLKAASYLMHWAGFSEIRTFVFDSSRYIIQDDSGIAYPFIDQQKWNVKLYGDYINPVPVFKNIAQPELKNVYYPHGIKDATIPALPLNYGYNFWQASVMVLRKK